MTNKEVIRINKAFAKGLTGVKLNNSAYALNYRYVQEDNYNVIIGFIEEAQAAFSTYKYSDAQIYGKAGLVERLSPSQRAYNTIKNAQMVHLQHSTNLALAVEDGSIDIDALQDEGLQPGKILVYRQGAQRPDFLNNAGVNASMYAALVSEETVLLNEMCRITQAFICNVKPKIELKSAIIE